MSSAPDFMRYASCAKVDPEIMFPAPGDVAGIEDAKAVCAGCDARSECLAWALSPEGRIPDGVVGGLSTNERRKIKKAPARRYYVGRIPAKSHRHAATA